MGPLYRKAVKEYDRVLRPGGKAVLLTADFAALKDAVKKVDWKMVRMFKVRVLGQRACVSMWLKP